MDNSIEQGTIRRDTFFCTNRDRHAELARVIEAVKKEITVFGRRIEGWVITTEAPMIDKVISLSESLGEDIIQHDSE